MPLLPAFLVPVASVEPSAFVLLHYSEVAVFRALVFASAHPVAAAVVYRDLQLVLFRQFL
jgi:hypothetical protein